MRNIVITLFVLLCTSASVAIAQVDDNRLSEILSQNHSSTEQNNEKVSPIVLNHLFEGSNVASKLKSGWKPKSKKTTNISLITVNGVTVHLALYPDLCIATALDGSKVGLQIISTDYNSNNPTVKDSSRKFEIKGDCVVHSYAWGKVYSYKSNKQEIKVKK